MSSSDLSSLSSVPSTDNEEEFSSTVGAGSLDHYLENGTNHIADPTGRPSSQRKRPASPPHEYVLADNADIAVSLNAFTTFSRQCLVALACVVALRKLTPWLHSLS